MMNIEIRAFDESDQAAVIALWKACELVVPWNDPVKDIARKLGEKRELFLLAEHGNEIVGCAMGGYEGHRGWINYLAVHPAQQRQGIGELLVKNIEARLLAMGCPKINLMIRSTNEGVVRFYKRIGYRQDDVVAMGKRLIPDD